MSRKIDSLQDLDGNTGSAREIELFMDRKSRQENWELEKRCNGSHKSISVKVKGKDVGTVCIPQTHGGEIRGGTLKSILRVLAGMGFLLIISLIYFSTFA